MDHLGSYKHADSDGLGLGGSEESWLAGDAKDAAAASEDL